MKHHLLLISTLLILTRAAHVFAAAPQEADRLYVRFIEHMDKMSCPCDGRIPEDCKPKGASPLEPEQQKEAFAETVSALKAASSKVDVYLAEKIKPGQIPRHLNDYLRTIGAFPACIENALVSAAKQKLSEETVSALTFFIPGGRCEQWLPELLERGLSDEASLKMYTLLLRRASAFSNQSSTFIDLALDVDPALLSSSPPLAVSERVKQKLLRPMGFDQTRAIGKLLGLFWAENLPLRPRLTKLTEGSVELEAAMLSAALNSDRYKKASRGRVEQSDTGYVETLTHVTALLGRADADIYHRYFRSSLACLWAVNPEAVDLPGFNLGVKRLLFDYNSAVQKGCGGEMRTFREEWTRRLTTTPIFDSADRNSRLKFLDSLKADLMPYLDTLSRPSDDRYEVNLLKHQLVYTRYQNNPEYTKEVCRRILPRIQSLIDAEARDVGSLIYSFSSSEKITEPCGDELIRFLEKAPKKTVYKFFSYLPNIRRHLKKDAGRRFDTTIKKNCERLNDKATCAAAELYFYKRSNYRKKGRLKKAFSLAADLSPKKRKKLFSWIFETITQRTDDTPPKKSAKELEIASKGIKGRSDELDEEISNLVKSVRNYVPFIFSW